MNINQCIMASYSEDVGLPGATVPFFIHTILLDLEGGRYVGPLLPGSLAYLVSGRCSIGGGGSSR